MTRWGWKKYFCVDSVFPTQRSAHKLTITTWHFRARAQRLPDGLKTLPSGQPATQLLAIHQTQAVIGGQRQGELTQLLGAWLDRDTGVALES